MNCFFQINGVNIVMRSARDLIELVCLALSCLACFAPWLRPHLRLFVNRKPIYRAVDILGIYFLINLNQITECNYERKMDRILQPWRGNYPTIQRKVTYKYACKSLVCQLICLPSPNPKFLKSILNKRFLNAYGIIKQIKGDIFFVNALLIEFGDFIYFYCFIKLYILGVIMN